MICLKLIKNKICKIESGSNSQRVSLESMAKDKLQILQQELNQIDFQIDSLKNNNSGALSSQDTIKYRLLSSQRQEKYSQIEFVLNNNPIFQLERAERELASLQNPRGRRLKQGEIIRLGDEIIALKDKITSIEDSLTENQEKIDLVPDGAISAYSRIKAKLELLYSDPIAALQAMSNINKEIQDKKARRVAIDYSIYADNLKTQLEVNLKNITTRYDGIEIAAAKKSVTN
jgi:hypothetical protein